MADISAVEETIAAIAASFAYPNGMAQVSAVGPDVKIFRGFPDTLQVDSDMEKGICDVAVYSMPGGSRSATRYPPTWHSMPLPPCTLTVTSSGNVVTFGGTPALTQLASLTAANIGFSYVVQANDTLASIATALAGIVNADGRLVASANGPSVAVTTTGGNGKTATGFANPTGTAWRETARQQQRIRVAIYAPTPEFRDILGSAIRTGFSDPAYDFIDVGDPTTTRLQYADTVESDVGTNATLYQRFIDFLAEFPTIQTQVAAPMVFGVGNLDIDAADQTFGTLEPAAVAALT